MRARNAASRTIDYTGLIDQIANQAASPLAVETPSLGRVEFHSPANMRDAVYLLTMLQNQAAGVPSTGVFVAVYNRGLSCPTNGGCE